MISRRHVVLAVLCHVPIARAQQVRLSVAADAPASAPPFQAQIRPEPDSSASGRAATPRADRIGATEPGGVPEAAADARGGGRAAALRAVVRLTAGRRLVCSGTVVRVGDRPGVLTAAHCLFHTGVDGVMTAPLARLEAEGVGALSLREARVSRRFAACVDAHLSYESCHGSGAEDLAWIPFVDGTSAVAEWSVCDEMGVRDVTIFGYGLSGRALPRTLLQGTFRLRPVDPMRVAREAVGRGVAIDAGDSGGPVISDTDDRDLAFRRPCVRYVAVAVRVADPLDPGARSRAVVNPVSGAEVLRLGR